MKTRRLGGTELEVGVIGLGAMPLSLAGRPPEDQSIAVIHRALELGVSFIDTADAYCRDEEDKHHNERLIQKAVERFSGDVGDLVVATKGGLMRHGGAWTPNGDPAHLRRTIWESREALGDEWPITLWQLHAPDPAFPVEKSLLAAREAVDAGVVRHVGLSNITVEQLRRARDVVDIVSVQNQYNPWERSPESDGMLAYCEQEGLTFLPWGPLGGRARVSRLEDIGALRELAADKGISVYGVVLAWLMGRSPCILPIPGASRVASIEDSIRAAEVRLSEDERERFEVATRTRG